MLPAVGDHRSRHRQRCDRRIGGEPGSLRLFGRYCNCCRVECRRQWHDPADLPSGTSTATIAYDESIENVLGVTNRNAPLRGIGIWDATAVTINNTISLAKSASVASYTAVGQIITYTYVVTNNGPLPINTSQNIQIQDNKIGTFACGTISSAIPSGGTVTCTNTYAVTAADVSNAAGVTNTAIAGIGTSGQSFASRLQSPQVSVTVANAVIDAVNDSFSGTPINGPPAARRRRCSATTGWPAPPLQTPR